MAQDQKNEVKAAEASTDNQELDARFAEAAKTPDGQLSDTGILSVEDIGNGLVKVTDRDHRVSIFPKDAEPANMSNEQRQAAVDAAIDNSPVRNELSPAHSDYNPDGAMSLEDKPVEGEKVVNADLGDDIDDSNDKKGKE